MERMLVDCCSKIEGILTDDRLKNRLSTEEKEVLQTSQEYCQSMTKKDGIEIEMLQSSLQ